MRIWGVPVALMCDKHLGGEHVEMHMFKSVIELDKKVDGYIRDKLLDTLAILTRHEELSREMLKRGMKHNSPLLSVSYPEGFVHRNSVDPHESEMELVRRCPKCRERFEAANGREKYAHIPYGGDSVIPGPVPYTYEVIYNGEVIKTVPGWREKAVKYLEDHRRKMRACR